MNKVILMGRLVRDPEIRYTSGQDNMAIGRYTLAVDRVRRSEAETQADFIPCVVFGKMATFSEKYFRKGQKILISGRIQTGSYTNRDGHRIFTTDVVVETQEFCESKGGNSSENPAENADGFMGIPDGIEEELPFN